MKGKFVPVAIALVILLALSAGLGTAQGPAPHGAGQTEAMLGSAFTYQGQLKKDGTPVNDTCTMVFSLYDNAAAGNLVGDPITLTVTVANGLFTAVLNSGGEFGLTAFSGEARWLEVAVQCTGDAALNTLPPRQELTAAPYALSLRPGALIDGETAVPGLRVVNRGEGDGVAGYSYATDGRGVYGWAWAHSGDARGVFGVSDSTAGTGVAGRAAADSGETYGVSGEAASTNGRGVYGEATATNGVNYGIYGQSASTAGRGVYGEASATSGTTYGVQGLSAAASGRGVFGLANATSGTSYGVYGLSASTGGIGVYGEATAASGDARGVSGSSASTEGRGVAGYATAANGETYGVYGQSASTEGVGVYGEATATTGNTYGVFGYNENGYGVGAYVQAGTAVYARADGASTAVHGFGGIGLYGESWGGLPLFLTGWGGEYLILATELPTGSVRFEVTEPGDVYADGGYYSPAPGFAEMVPGVAGLEAGDVLVVGPDGSLARCDAAYQPTVVGVYAPQAGFVSGKSADTAGQVPVAVMGFVLVKVSAENGPIVPGDLLVAAATPGHAMRAGANPALGTVIGKALGSLDKGTGTLLMLVMLR